MGGVPDSASFKRVRESALAFAPTTVFLRVDVRLSKLVHTYETDPTNEKALAMLHPTYEQKQTVPRASSESVK